MVVPSLRRAGSWSGGTWEVSLAGPESKKLKQLQIRLFPPPVGITTMISRPDSVAFNAGSCEAAPASNQRPFSSSCLAIRTWHILKLLIPNLSFAKMRISSDQAQSLRWKSTALACFFLIPAGAIGAGLLRHDWILETSEVRSFMRVLSSCLSSSICCERSSSSSSSFRGGGELAAVLPS